MAYSFPLIATGEEQLSCQCRQSFAIRLLEVLLQLKAYQRVVAPFDGVVTQRNIDNGSLVQADIAGGIAMFTVMHSFFPDLSASRTQCGCRPRPAHVCDGSFGFRYFGATDPRVPRPRAVPRVPRGS
jgi:hypothetical protein